MNFWFIELNDIDNFITLRQPNELLQIILYGDLSLKIITAWKVSKYGVLSGPHFHAFGLNTEIYYSSETSKITMTTSKFFIKAMQRYKPLASRKC